MRGEGGPPPPPPQSTEVAAASSPKKEKGDFTATSVRAMTRGRLTKCSYSLPALNTETTKGSGEHPGVRTTESWTIGNELSRQSLTDDKRVPVSIKIKPNSRRAQHAAAFDFLQTVTSLTSMRADKDEVE